MLMSNAIDRDHVAHLSGIKYELSKLSSAADILHSLVHNDGDQVHLEWVADKLLDDTHKLFDEFIKSFGKIIDAVHAPQQAAE
ncbi:hypothetical protein EOW77_0028230 [Bradyrhizobium yuanmingense]|uniref:hypothetical protein n=1 Tax=Bradyrhizobium yuanmingense TaxID=108015 RepID=UPI000FE2B0A3|nr:hypothetical protein [Bradyrhizobium yuanmingense]TGN80509.1 hypothetical protein EOW77_0028230 [Bradyrhizobium yuanmingense]